MVQVAAAAGQRVAELAQLTWIAFRVGLSKCSSPRRSRPAPGVACDSGIVDPSAKPWRSSPW